MQFDANDSPKQLHDRTMNSAARVATFRDAGPALPSASPSSSRRSSCAALVGILVSLVLEAWPAFREFGLGFLSGTTWSPADDVYGAVIAIYGTLVTSVIALLIAVPISFGIALFLTETCPLWLRRPLGTAIELLAGVPVDHLRHLGPVRVGAAVSRIRPAPAGRADRACRRSFSGPPLGIGIFTAGIVLALMVIPFIASVMRDVFETVPPVLKESAYGIGCTTWEVVRNIVLPYTRVGVIGGIMLGLGRALGETMAVTFVIGNANRIVGQPVRARQLDRLDAGQRIRRGRPRAAHPLAVRAGPAAVRDHLLVLALAQAG